MAPGLRRGMSLGKAKTRQETMMALAWQGPGRVAVVDAPRPVVQEAADAVVKITSASLSGSDLHLYHGRIPAMRAGAILGHECMGIVEEVGPGVVHRRPGDRVVVASVVSDGECWYCVSGLHGHCETTNARGIMERLYGQARSGVLGHSDLLGGYPGGQAEAIRVPHADVNLLPVPDTMRDEQALFLSDLLCAGYHAVEQGRVNAGHTVAVWGCGPVGLMAQEWARHRGAQVVAIDRVPERLDVARRRGATTIDFEERDVLDTLKEVTQGRGPDVCIEAVGMAAAEASMRGAGRDLAPARDSIGALDACIRACRKGGTVSVVGDFVGRADGFPTGALMQKGLTVAAGPVHVQRHWRELLALVEERQVDPTFLVTHRFPLERAAQAYEMADARRDGVLKVVLGVTDA